MDSMLRSRDPETSLKERKKRIAMAAHSGTKDRTQNLNKSLESDAAGRSSLRRDNLRLRSTRSTEDAGADSATRHHPNRRHDSSHFDRCHLCLLATFG
ncbi:hypothetical protein [Paraburkholderia bannensis]|uniref:hypothetical protein n=1 Tax=Paraburkholderia bannensis TaxID=765414 RepID=UPI002ABD18F8|nr:hypothetical protein [Paraburkholderia bannensis]